MRRTSVRERHQAVFYAILRFDDTAVLSKQSYAYGSADIAANYLAATSP